MPQPSFLALLAFLSAAGTPGEHVRIPEADGTVLDAALVRPAGTPTGPAIVALHGCGGPYPSRDGSWARLLSQQGHVVLLPDSFGSRGLGSQCRERNRAVTPRGLRRTDAITAGLWLAEQADTHPAGAAGIALMGWSNGGQTVLATANQAPEAPTGLPKGLFDRFVAFYPGCASTAANPAWQPAAPLLILVGQADDWTPAAPCQAVQRKDPARITLVSYPGAYHDFDAPDRPVRVLNGLSTPRGGQAHVGTDPAARTDALARVPAFLASR